MKKFGTLTKQPLSPDLKTFSLPRHNPPQLIRVHVKKISFFKDQLRILCGTIFYLKNSSISTHQDDDDNDKVFIALQSLM
jgi:hypothetical protein